MPVVPFTPRKRGWPRGVLEILEVAETPGPAATGTPACRASSPGPAGSASSPSVGSSRHSSANARSRRGSPHELTSARCPMPVAQQDQVGVVGHEAGGRSEVEDAARRGTDVAVGVDVGHHVVAQFLLVVIAPRRGSDLLGVLAQLGHLLRRVIGSPSSASLSASAIHRRRQVVNFLRFG